MTATAELNKHAGRHTAKHAQRGPINVVLAGAGAYPNWTLLCLASITSAATYRQWLGMNATIAIATVLLCSRWGHSLTLIFRHYTSGRLALMPPFRRDDSRQGIREPARNCPRHAGEHARRHAYALHARPGRPHIL